MSIANSTNQAPLSIALHFEAVSSELQLPPAAATLNGFLDWASSDSFPEQGHVHFIKGKLWIDMSPELFESHNFLKTEITSVLYGLVKREKLGLLFSDRSLFTNEQANVSTEPDAMFVARGSIQTGRSKLVESQSEPGMNSRLQGSPDWVLEIVSPSSRKKDCEVLRDAYYQAGIGEYWIVDALGDQIEFLLLTRGENEYVAAAPDESGWLASPTFNKSFRLERETDDDGFLQYTLHFCE